VKDECRLLNEQLQQAYKDKQMILDQLIHAKRKVKKLKKQNKQLNATFAQRAKHIRTIAESLHSKFLNA
jgi:flagellar biosynthesis/type III secretory pathway chaperone